ncbi:MAG: PTS sugar transporter subunit IIC, partial [Candidatus Asgardarchaeia archaeon]
MSEGKSFSEKVFEFMETKLMPPLARIGEQRHLVAIRDGLATSMPLLIVGAFFLIPAFPPVPEWDAAVEPFRDMLLVPTDVTIGLISVYAAFNIAFMLATRYETDPIQCG